jgi:hypothetical protein
MTHPWILMKATLFPELRTKVSCASEVNYIPKGTMQEICLRLMGRKMLVALMMEGKFSGERSAVSLDADEDLMSAMARELVEEAGIGRIGRYGLAATR